MKEKEFLIDDALIKHKVLTDPEVEVVHDPMSIEMDVVTAIRLVQRNERGR